MSDKEGPSSASTGQRKKALIIGQNNYQFLDRLYLSENDAELIDKTLQKLGFKTTVRTNLTHDQLKFAIREFSLDLEENDIACFYYSGHGSQQKSKSDHKTDNFLFGIDAQRETQEEGSYVTRGVPLHYQIIYKYFVEKCIYLIILDACRTYPKKNEQLKFKSQLSSQVPPESAMTLMVPELPKHLKYREFDFVFACQPGKYAIEELSRSYGYLSTALNEQLSQPQPWCMALVRTIQQVQNESKHQQYPNVQLNVGKVLQIISNKSNLLSLDFVEAPQSSSGFQNNFGQNSEMFFDVPPLLLNQLSGIQNEEVSLDDNIPDIDDLLSQLEPPITSNDNCQVTFSENFDDQITVSNSKEIQTDEVVTTSFEEPQMTSNNMLGSPQFEKCNEWNSCIIPMNKLNTIKKLNRGDEKFEKLFLGEWCHTYVAIKEIFPPDYDYDFYSEDYDLNPQGQKDFEEEFIREIQIMMSLRHENIVQFYGAVLEPKKLIVTELVNHGSIYYLLHRQEINKQFREYIKNDLGRRLEMALHAARGVNYLHNKKVWHSNLKTQNLLVGEGFKVKVCDFGFSRIKVLRTCQKKGTFGSPEYMAPEVLRDGKKSEKADIYSFGVVLYELVTKIRPWQNTPSLIVWAQVALANKKLEIPENVDERIKQVILKCWEDKPIDRPTFDEIIRELEQIMKHYPKKLYVPQKQNSQGDNSQQ